MNYHFARQLLLRMPVKMPVDYSHEPQVFLDDDLFRAAIRVATPAFYTLLKSRRFRLTELNFKEAHTLQKYINRYCFRPTPFGLFSSVTPVEWRDDPSISGSPPTYKAFIRTSMPMQNQLYDHLLAAGQITGLRFESNPSIYRVLNEYRFFRTGLDETGKQRHYQLQSIAFSKLLKDLLSLCSNGQPLQVIVDKIAVSAACSTAEAIDYAGFLIDAQLLLNCERLSITGDDPLSRLVAKLEGGPLKEAFIRILQKQADTNKDVNPEILAELEHDLDHLIPGQKPHQEKLSIIFKAADQTAGPDAIQQQNLRDGIQALDLLCAAGLSPTMSKFIDSYEQHFEGQSLPLLHALDPEAGIGYQQPEKETDNPLLETVNIRDKNALKTSGNWSTSHSVLLEAWLRDGSAETVIHLAPGDLERLKASVSSAPLLGMSVLFRVVNDEVLIESAGGINAPALLGRFTVADQSIAAAAQAMASRLEELNPGILFAELLHLTDPHTDNVNRRVHIYRYELPITAASTLPDTQQLQLSDLYIRIIDNKAMLFSAKHQKFVIPRLTSAYNHSLNKLPLFRFLADLSYQYGRSSLALDLRQLFPGLHFYPRLVYKKAILTAATWIITKEQVEQVADQTHGMRHFREISQAIRLPRYFLLVEGDQELVFDSQKEAEVRFFMNCANQKKELILKEHFAQPQVRQYNACLLPAEPLAFPKLVKFANSKNTVQRKYMPGSEWLYLKIYVPKIAANRLLFKLAPLLKKRYGAHHIGQWFFIRYEDHAPHIRLRLQVDPQAISEVLLAFKTKLEDRIRQHVIREFQIDVYSRELERYRAGGIHNTERFFWADSELVLHFLQRSASDSSVSSPAFALYSTHHIISQFISAPEAQLAFTLQSFQQFLPEFGDAAVKIELDKKYRALAPGIQAAFSENDPTILSGSFKAAVNFKESLQIIRSCLKNDDPDYLRSLIHMHLNRLFTDDSRKQEMICYYLLHKYLRSVKGRNQHND